MGVVEARKQAGEIEKQNKSISGPTKKHEVIMNQRLHVVLILLPLSASIIVTAAQERLTALSLLLVLVAAVTTKLPTKKDDV